MRWSIALVNDPEFLILGEPFVDLDPDGVLQLIRPCSDMWASVRSIAMLSPLQELCERFLFIKGGRLADENEYFTEA